MVHTCSVLVATCIDFRFQKHIEEWLRKNIGERQYDRVAWAGGIYDSDAVMGQIDISVRLHHISKVILMNHEECGAYGEAGTYERHKSDLLKMAQTVKAKYPELLVETYYIHLDGQFEEIKGV